MNVEIINHSKIRIPRRFLIQWVCELEKLLKLKLSSKQYLKIKKQSLYLVFLDPKPALKLNLEFRHKNYATDVLSFDSEDADSLGELIMCPQVLKKQAKEHNLKLNEEIGYMVIHGLLHLLGYDHEKSPQEAKLMFRLQDSIYAKLCEILFD